MSASPAKLHSPGLLMSGGARSPSTIFFASMEYLERDFIRERTMAENGVSTRPLIAHSVCKFQSITSSEKRSGEESPACCEK